jgi:hypothetical protein
LRRLAGSSHFSSTEFTGLLGWAIGSTMERREGFY